MSLRERFDGLRSKSSAADADLERLWDDGDVLWAEDLSGSWADFGFATGHRVGAMLAVLGHEYCGLPQMCA
jgi:hypothetical protein